MAETPQIINGRQSDWLRIAQSAFDDSSNFLNAGPRRDIEQAIRQFQGRHPAGSKYLSDTYRARSRFFAPKTRTVIRKNEAVAAAALFSNTDVVEVTPFDDSDPMQRASAKLNKELLNLRLKKSIKWFPISMGAYQDAQTVGLCCSYQCWKYDAKKGIDQPAIELIPIENIRFSPGAHWYDVVRSSPYFIRMIPMYVKDVKARMQAPDGKTPGKKWKQLDDKTIMQALQSYSDSIRLQREQGRADSQSMPTTLNPYNIVWVHQNIAEVDGEDYLWYTLGTTQMLSDAQPLKDVWWHGRRPFVIGYSIIEAHKVYPDGVAGVIRDLQGELNEVRNLRLDNVKLAMNKRYFAKRGAQVDLRSLTRSTPGGVTLMNDPEKDVVPNEVKDVTSSAYAEQDRINNDADELSGSFSQSSVQGNKALSDRLGGMEMLSEDANQIQGYQLRTWVETWVEPVLEQVLLLEQHYETDENILSIAGKKANLGQDGEPTEITDNMLMQELGLVVHVGVGATSPRKQLENLLAAFQSIEAVLKDGVLDRYNLNAEEFINEVFGKLGYRDGARFFNFETGDPQISMLQQQLKQLQQALDAKHPPELIAAQVKKLEAETKRVLAESFNKNVEGLFGAVESAEVIAAIPGVAPVADTIAKAAGYQPSTPPGMDPNLDAAQPQTPDPNVQTKGPVINHRTGVGFNPVEAGRMLPNGMQENTHPLQPALPGKPNDPSQGVHQGISSVAQLQK
jgi:hypothetical protein